MHDSWTCVAVANGPGMIPDTIKNAFKRAACRLHREQRDQMLFQTEECSGLIKTDWGVRRVGGRSGILFKVELESEDGEWQVNFLLHDMHLEEGARRLDDIEFDAEGEWQSSPEYFPLEELWQFENLRPRMVN